MEVAEKPGFGDFDVFGGQYSDAPGGKGAFARKNATRGLDWIMVGL